MDAELMKESLENKIGEMDIEESNAVINRKLRLGFDGKIVRKDLTKHISRKGQMSLYMCWSIFWGSIVIRKMRR